MSSTLYAIHDNNDTIPDTCRELYVHYEYTLPIASLLNRKLDVIVVHYNRLHIIKDVDVEKVVVYGRHSSVVVDGYVKTDDIQRFRAWDSEHIGYVYAKTHNSAHIWSVLDIVFMYLFISTSVVFTIYTIYRWIC